MRTARVFTSKMVLQRRKPVPVWGKGTPGEQITVEIAEHKVTTAVNENGKWYLELPEMEAARNLTMTISSDRSQTITYSDVCVGEVWIAGGQSNMEYLLAFEKHFDDEIAGKETNTDIRFFDYPEVCYEGQLQDYDYSKEDFWMDCRDPYFGGMSAVGYYFAKQIYEKEQIPIGILGCNWGGTPACAWMDPAMLEDNEGQVWLQDYEKQTEGMDMNAFVEGLKDNPMTDRTNRMHQPFEIEIVKKGVSWEQQLGMIQMMAAQATDAAMPPINYERRPGGLYATMLNKIAPYAARGVIWYQGETDSDFHAAQYRTVFGRMIRCWRNLWRDELPFLFVQLAPFYRWLTCNGKHYVMLREQQEAVSREVPNTWMASIGDCGMEYDIHPKNKKPVGSRLGLLARRHVYGEEILADAPEVVDAERQGSDIIISFENGEGLHTSEAGAAIRALDLQKAPVEYEELTEAEMNGQIQPRWKTIAPVTDYRIENDKLILSNVPEDIRYIYFAKSDYYEVNLYNGAEIPVKPFVVEL